MGITQTTVTIFGLFGVSFDLKKLLAIWNNSLPNAILYFRLLCFMPEKENCQSVLTTFKLYMNSAYEMQNNHSELVINGSTFNLKLNTELAMIDGGDG